MKQRTIIDIFLVAIFFTACLFIFFYISNNCKGAIGNIFWIEKQLDVSVDESVVIHFSKPIVLGDFSPQIEINEEVEFEYNWSDSGKTLTIKPKKSWDLGTNYFVNIKNLRNLFFIESNISISFSTVNYPGVESFYPANNSVGVVIDIEDPLRANFDIPLDEFNIKFEVSPKRLIGYKMSDDKKTINFVFNDGYEKGQKYDIALYAKGKKEEAEKYQKIYETSFETEAPAVEDWSKDFSKRVAQARKFTTAKIKQGKYIDVNVSIQVMTIFDNGKILDSFLISSGKRGMDTPKGQFKISNKHPRPWSKKYGLYMPYWMAIVSSGKFGIHELPEWPGGYKEGQDHLGIPVSHGCVRLGIGSAKKVYEWAEIGTPVVIY